MRRAKPGPQLLSQFLVQSHHFALRSRLTTFLSVYFQVRVDSVSRRLSCVLSVRRMLAPLGKTHRRRRRNCSSREAGTVQPRSDAEGRAVALGTSRLGVVGLLPEAFMEADPIFKEPGRAGYRPEGLPLYIQPFKAAWIYCGS